MVELTSTSASNGTRNWYLYWYRCISSVDVFIIADFVFKNIQPLKDMAYLAYLYSGINDSTRVINKRILLRIW
jgi:hypothetical protein